jgi:hypothetical protein
MAHPVRHTQLSGVRQASVDPNADSGERDQRRSKDSRLVNAANLGDEYEHRTDDERRD